jgi:hypothetical protein
VQRSETSAKVRDRFRDQWVVLRSVTDVNVCGRSAMSVADQLCLWQISYVCDRSAMSVTDQLCLWQISYVCDRSAMSVADQLCLWQISYVCDRSAMIEWYIDLHLYSTFN